MNKLKTLIGIFLIVSLNSCLPPLPSTEKQEEVKVHLISFSGDSQEVVLMAEETIDLNNYVLRQGETKSLYSLSGIHLEKDVAQKINIPSNFLRKKNNSLSLSRLEVVSVLLGE